MALVIGYLALLLAFVLAGALVWLGRRKHRRVPHWDGLR
jgi:hypothetical protein